MVRMSPEWKYLYLTCSDRTKRWAQVALAAVSVVAVLGLVLATHLQPHNTLGQGEDTWILELATRVRLRLREILQSRRRSLLGLSPG